MPRPLSEAQRRIIAHIHEFTNAHGFPPTMQEIGNVVGMTRAGVRQQLGALAAMGYVTVEPFRARSVRLTPKVLPDEDLAEHSLLTIADHVRQTITKEFVA